MFNLFTKNKRYEEIKSILYKLSEQENNKYFYEKHNFFKSETDIYGRFSMGKIPIDGTELHILLFDGYSYSFIFFKRNFTEHTENSLHFILSNCFTSKQKLHNHYQKNKNLLQEITNVFNKLQEIK